MQQQTGFSLFAALLLWAFPAGADPVSFHPEGCDFEISFPAAPALSQTKSDTNRGDAVTTTRAVLNESGLYLRAECTHVPAMHFLDEGILNNNMRDMGTAYKLTGLSTGVDHNEISGPIGWLRGQGKLGGRDVTIEVRRFTGKASIFDVWMAAPPDAFPAPAAVMFLKTVKAEGKPVP